MSSKAWCHCRIAGMTVAELPWPLPAPEMGLFGVDPFATPPPGCLQGCTLPHHGLFLHPGEDVDAALARPLALLREAGSSALVLHDGLQHQSSLVWFEAADRLGLDVGAQMRVLDLFALRTGGPEHTVAPRLDEFTALARRFGWRLQAEQDLSREALPSYPLLQRRLAHAGRGPAPRQAAIAAAEARARLLAEGVLAYRLLRLQRTSVPALRLARVEAADAPAMRQLFERVFGHPMTAPEWQWKYGHGQGVAVGLYRGSEMLAHYGGLTRTLLLMGQPGLGCQVGDVMVAPAANGGLGRRLPLHDVAATLLECEIGWGRRHAVGFGFPSSRHMQVAERLGLYAPVDGITQLSWPALAFEGDGWDAVEVVDAASIDASSATGSALQGLWAEMAHALAASVLGVRDPAWLRYRYGQRPGVPYRLLLWREPGSGQALGAVVLRAHADRLELMDLVAHPSRFAGLVQLAKADAARLGLPQVQAWVSSSHAALLQDPAQPAHAEALDVTVPANVHTPGMAPADLQGRWFLMGGDTDFR